MRYVAVIGMLAMFAVACGGDDDVGASGAEDALETLIERIAAGQGGRAYETMHPAQQAIVPRDTYVQCSQGIGNGLEDFEVSETYEEEVAIPGTDERATSTAITYSLGIAGQSLTDTSHMVNVDGTWRWILNDPEPFIEGHCP